MDLGIQPAAKATPQGRGSSFLSFCVMFLSVNKLFLSKKKKNEKKREREGEGEEKIREIVSFGPHRISAFGNAFDSNIYTAVERFCEKVTKHQTPTPHILGRHIRTVDLTWAASIRPWTAEIWCPVIINLMLQK